MSLKSKPPEELACRVGPLVNLARIVSSLGADPDLIFERAGFQPRDFEDPDHRIGYLRGSQLLAECVKSTGCDHLGLLMGIQATPSHLGVSGFLVRAASTVKAALNAVIDNLDLHDEGGAAWLDEDDEYVKFGYAIQIPGVTATDQIYDLSAAMLCQIMRSVCGKSWKPSTVFLQRSEPAQLPVYRRFFASPVHFDSTENAIMFPRMYLNLRPPAADPLLFHHLEEEARELHSLQQHELIDELPAALHRGLLTDQFAAGDIANMFGLHERTLHRRLNAAGTSFRVELDQARRTVSEQLLSGTNLPVCDIAKSLGYSDSSGFIRAFHRWSGSSPLVWRKRNDPRLQ